MTDPRLRALEREYLTTRDPSAGAQLLVAKRRAGLVRPDQIRWAAAFGNESAARALKLLRLRKISTTPRETERVLDPVYEREGWSLFDSNYGLEIERIDDPQAWFMPTDPRSDEEIQRIINGWEHWGSDLEVMRSVVRKAAVENSPPHLLALLLVRQENPSEYGDTAHVYYGGEYLGVSGRFGGTPHELEDLDLMAKSAAARLDMEIAAGLLGPEFGAPVSKNSDEELRRLEREIGSKPSWRVSEAERVALRRAKIRRGDLVCVACGRRLDLPHHAQDRREDARGLVCWRCFHGMKPNPGRGDEAIRQAQRGEGGDPKIEAWRRGIAVPPDRVWSNAPEWRAYWNLPSGGFVEVMLADVLQLSTRDLPVGAVVYPSRTIAASRAHQLYGWVCDERGSHLMTPGTFVVWQVDPGRKGPDWLDPAIQSAVYAAYSKPRANPPGPACPECGGASLLLGELGGAQCYRCRQCNWHWQLRHGAPAPRAVLPADVCGWCAPHPCQCPKPKAKKRKKNMNPARGDEAIRRSQRGEGGDPKLEAWRRGLPVPPDVVRPLRQDWPATVSVYWLTPGAAPIPEERSPAAPAVWPQAVHAMSWLYSSSGGVKRAYRVWMGPRPNESGDVNTFDYGNPHWDNPQVQQFVQIAYVRALEEQHRGY